MRTPRLDIIIVNWNSGAQVQECILSVAETQHSGFTLNRIVVIDNGSTDGSVDQVTFAHLPGTLIRNSENKGFSAACNQGARESTADFLLFLNPDVRLFANSLTIPLTFFVEEKNARVGIAGIQLVDDAGAIQRTCVRFPAPFQFLGISLGLDRILPGVIPGHFLTEWDHTESREVDQVMGAFFLVRRDLFESLGGFDERFFVYYEELDFSLRARKQGYSSWYLATAGAFHRGGGTTDQVKATRLFYALRSRTQYAYKHFGWFPATGVALVSSFAEPVIRSGYALLKGTVREIPEILQGYRRFWGVLPRLMVHGRDTRP